MDAKQNSRKLNLTIPEYLNKTRADRIIPELVNSLSRNQAQRLLKLGMVRKNAKTLKPNSLLNSGDEIQVEIPAPKKIDLDPWNCPLDVLFEDSDLIAINKPQGMVVHPSDSFTGKTLVHALLHHAKDLSGIGGKIRPGIVHRIDKDTSGVIIVAKNDQTHQKLTQQFQSRQIHKNYLALCYGIPKKNQIHIETQIDRNPKNRKKMISVKSGGRIAVSEFKILKKYHSNDIDFASLIDVNIKTGRTHQIRVHATELGHSVIGDVIYGHPSTKQKKWKDIPDSLKEKFNHLPGQLLHANRIRFFHPSSMQEMELSAELPKEFMEVLNSLAEFEIK